MQGCICRGRTYILFRIKVRTVQEAPPPRSVAQLKSYLGLLTYYSKFLPNLSSTLSPLYRLLRQSTCWCWTPKEQEAFEASKQLLTSAPLLVHFNPELEITLSCDASPYGLGAVLSHRMPDGTEKPVGYASRTLTQTEQKYSQIEKEGLACVFGVKKFHSYLYGHRFTLVTDHKPLLSLFNESCCSSPGIRLYTALGLQLYEYILSFRSSARHRNADALSRLPL